MHNSVSTRNVSATAYPAGQLTGLKYTEACEVLSVEKFITNGVWLACSRRMAFDLVMLAKPVPFSMEL